MGGCCISELVGEDHKHVRDALVSFLKPESLKQYIGKMDEEVRNHLEMHWHGKEQVTLCVTIDEDLTFTIICSLLFGIERGPRREKLADDFRYMVEGIWSIPVNLPFTRYNRSLKSSARAQKLLKHLIGEKRDDLKHGASPRQDLITYLLSIRDDKNKQVISEIQHGFHHAVLQCCRRHDLLILVAEQEDIAKNKHGELLTWEDHAKMKYTWKVVMETLRLFPPIFGGFRKAVKDFEYGGYLIPKDWLIFWVTGMTQMDDTIFPEPSKFDPNRFEDSASLPPYCFIPFGGGPRICPGYEFARIETLVSIHYLVTRFTWKILCSDNSFSRDPMLAPAKGLPVQISPRKLL
ncbi:hypothetical protein V6N11_038720 [Hibiscus sabdariffa]|uniref:Cytochrome P450 n=1 Tax=Hibiscus sabdariffa TaxID=183260 RepID=A0ABR2SLG6_9ROSI